MSGKFSQEILVGFWLSLFISIHNFRVKSEDEAISKMGYILNLFFYMEGSLSSNKFTEVKFR